MTTQQPTPRASFGGMHSARSSVLPPTITPRRSAMRLSTAPTPKRTPARGQMARLPELEPPKSVLLEDLEDNTPMIDFSALFTSMRVFVQRFEAHILDACNDVEEVKAEDDAKRMESKELAKSVAKDIENAKMEQKILWDAVAAERQADEAQRAQVKAYTAQSKAAETRMRELEEELREASGKVESRRRAKEAQRDMMKSHMRQNRPELDVLELRTGLTMKPTRIDDEILFLYRLLNAKEPMTECSFVIDISTRIYEVHSMDPPLEASAVEAALSELNSTRELNNFLKQMRSLFKVEVERRRLASSRRE